MQYNNEGTIQAMRYCRACGKPITDGRFEGYTCSPECSKRILRGTVANSHTFYCIWCGNPMPLSGNNLYCSAECRAAIGRKKIRIAKDGGVARCKYCGEPLTDDDALFHPECEARIEADKVLQKRITERKKGKTVSLFEVAHYCRQCGKPLSQQRTEWYCSPECKKKHGAAAGYCATCGKLIDKREKSSQKYCSGQCRINLEHEYNKYRYLVDSRAGVKKQVHRRECARCFEFFEAETPKQKYCPRCTELLEQKRTQKAASWDDYDEACREAKAQGKWISYGEWSRKKGL